MKNNLVLLLLAGFLLHFIQPLDGQSTSNHGNKFEQLGTLLPSPNTYRNMDGSPGPEYWQQRADYDIECTLDEKIQQLRGQEKITYYNQSPSTLAYLWLQLDENEHHSSSSKHKMDGKQINPVMSENQMRMLEPWHDLEKYGHKILSITDANGDSLTYTIDQTMMRVELPEPLKPGEQFSFSISWYYNLIDRMNSTSWGRGGYEYFEKDGNHLFTIVQWYPRLCVYNDATGWQTKQFVGRGEFALTFGNFVVKITVPEDHVVGATGECINYAQVLSPEQYVRWKLAQQAKAPIEIVTLDEAKKAEKNKNVKGTKTWIYKADNVRDFAWTSSRKFIWDGMPHYNEDGKRAMCMSYYAKEAYPIYSRYSTKAVNHTLSVYSKYSIPYPYPSAISVEAANGMEYPMISFNPGRAEEDGTYSENSKNDAISTIIHEVGHTYFPMIINSDERQWAWFDEGINSFMQFLAESEWDPNYPHWYGPAENITAYMAQPKDKLEPIMTNSENIVSYFANAYMKPACGLNILRETIMGREKFDYAFKTYCERWAFKHPTPADFFRTMEDASGVDLDWFWRGWFYSIDAVDVSLDSIKWYKVDLEHDPEKKEVTNTQREEPPSDHISRTRNKEAGIEYAVENDPALQDFYYNYKPWEGKDSVTTTKSVYYDKTFTEEEKKEKFGDNNYYELFFSNKGGLVMPVIIEWTYSDGTKEIEKVPVEIWRHNETKFRKVFVKNKEVTGIVIDPYKETADIDTENNNWPVKELPSRFQVYKQSTHDFGPNGMQRNGATPGRS
ncbi:MAG TPA: M1 family metallopeptidase [Saprospiraceae bacterium]|jgi:peptidase M1-like protein